MFKGIEVSKAGLAQNHERVNATGHKVSCVTGGMGKEIKLEKA